MFRVIDHEAASLSGITSPSILAELVAGVEGKLDRSVDHAHLDLGKPRQRIFSIPVLFFDPSNLFVRETRLSKPCFTYQDHSH